MNPIGRIERFSMGEKGPFDKASESNDGHIRFSGIREHYSAVPGSGVIRGV